MSARPIKLIKTDPFARTLRRKAINVADKKVLITNFAASDQEHDLTLPANCSGFGRIHHFKRFQSGDWPPNPLPIDPALHYLGLPARDQIQVQVFQNAACSWRCWYCFVDDELLAANPAHASFMSANELLDLYLREPSRAPIIDLSGGQPDLVPEWILWTAEGLRERGLETTTYLWSDDNLSNDYLWRFLGDAGVRRLASYKNYARVGCFKGFDASSFSFNTRAEPALFKRQFEVMKRLIDSDLDVYGYVTMTAQHDAGITQRVRDFVDMLQEQVHPLFPLRTAPLKIFTFTPTEKRKTQVHESALAIQLQAVRVWQEELAKRFPIEVRLKPIFEHSIH
jgi:uncharacterized Fe-S cluster-containing radical SAM superfamily protein